MDSNSYKMNDLIAQKENQMLEQRVQKIRNILNLRSLGIIPVLEKIYDQGNIHAVVRTTENLGLQELHIIQSNKVKKSPRITKGCEKWMDIYKHENTKECIQKLRSKGYLIVSTALNSKSIPLCDFLNEVALRKIAVIFGNEHAGVEQETMDLSDRILQIPSYGFSQSFNISVAAGIILHQCNHTQRQHPDFFKNFSFSANEKSFNEKLLQWYGI